MERLRAQAQRYGFWLNWAKRRQIKTDTEDCLHHSSHEEEWEIQIELHGKDHHGLPRHRVVSARSDTVEQALEKLLVEIQLLKFGKGTDGS